MSRPKIAGSQWGARLVYARRSAGEDHRQRVELADTIRRDVVADDPRERVPLANPTRDELDVLRTEVEDEHRSRCDIGIQIHGYAALSTRNEAIPPRNASLEPGAEFTIRGRGRQFEELRRSGTIVDGRRPRWSILARSDRIVHRNPITIDLPGAPIMNLETPIFLSSFCLVRIREEPEGQFTAELLGAPDIQATAATREAAIEQVRAVLQYQVDMGSIASIEIPRQNPLMKFAGHLKDDPDFDLYVEEIRKFREEADRRDGRVWETEECSDTSSTPTT